MVAKEVTISLSVTGLVPSASAGTSLSLLWRTPMARAGLAPGLLHVIELVVAPVAAADPCLDGAGRGFDGQEAGLQHRLLLAQVTHELGVALHQLERLGVAVALLARLLVACGVADPALH